jgi:hypothetical protein
VNRRDRTLDDTTADALAVQIRALRRIGPGGRAAMRFERGDNLRALVEAGVLGVEDMLTRLLKEAGEQAERIDGFEE